MNYFFIFLLIIFLCKSIFNQNCEMIFHNFYLLPLIKEFNNGTIPLKGLQKYDYLLILKTEPKNIDKYHIVLNVSFPININIELSNEIIYNFISLEKFCINDLEIEGKYVNILGQLSEYSTTNKILERVWIKVEKILLYKELEYNNNNKIYYLLSNYTIDRSDKEYILMKKMSKDGNQIFQIVAMNIIKNENELKNNYLCEEEPYIKNELSIGDELTLILRFGDEKLRENLDYSAFVKSSKSYIIKSVRNLLCITYNLNKYDGKC